MKVIILKKFYFDKMFFFIWEIDIIICYGVFNIKMELWKIIDRKELRCKWKIWFWLDCN